MSDEKRVWISLLKVLRTSTYRSLLTVTAAPSSSMKIGPMMPLAEIAANRALRRVQRIGVYFIRSGGPPEEICLGVHFSIKIEVGFI